MNAQQQALQVSLRGMQSAIGGLTGAMNNPLTRLGIRYWWASIPVVLAGYGKIKERKEQGSLKIHNVISDIGGIVFPIVGIITLVEFAKKQEGEQPAVAGLLPQNTPPAPPPLTYT